MYAQSSVGSFLDAPGVAHAGDVHGALDAAAGGPCGTSVPPVPADGGSRRAPIGPPAKAGWLPLRPLRMHPAAGPVSGVHLVGGWEA